MKPGRKGATPDEVKAERYHFSHSPQRHRCLFVVPRPYRATNAIISGSLRIETL
jgi:hypothetical protein